MRIVPSPFDTESLSELFGFPVDPGYEYAAMDLADELLQESDVPAEKRRPIYRFFDAMIEQRELPEIPQESQQEIVRFGAELKRRYIREHESYDPGHMAMQSAIRHNQPAMLEYAAELGCAAAARAVGQMLLRGSEPYLAREWFAKAIVLGDVSSFSFYGELVHQQEEEETPGIHELSLSIFQEGIINGNGDCALRIIEHGLDEGNPRAYLKFAKERFASHYHSGVAFVLAQEGKTKEAIEELTIGMAEGDKLAFARMGHLYLMGVHQGEVHIEPDNALAKAYAEQGDTTFGEAAFVYAGAKLRLGEDLQASIQQLRKVWQSGSVELAKAAAKEIRNAFQGRYGDAAREAAQSIILDINEFDHLPTRWKATECMKNDQNQEERSDA